MSNRNLHLGQLAKEMDALRETIRVLRDELSVKDSLLVGFLIEERKKLKEKLGE